MEFFHTYISPRSTELVLRTLHTGWLSEGDMVKEFEMTLSRALGLSNPVAVNSGTSALHLALTLAGIGAGDEVILPPQTFIATGMAVAMQGATCVFADIDPATGNIATASILNKITSRTKAIMPVHWGGYPCDLDEINAIALKHRLIVIEDAAHALGAAYKGRQVGSISRFTAFSFQAVKHLTTGDGGALCCTDGNDARMAFMRRWFGIDRANSKLSILGERAYDVKTVGYKYHMNDLAAAIGLGNIEDFPQRLARRQQIGAYYRERLSGVPGLQLLMLDNDRTHAYWLFTILVERREDFIRKLAAYGIPSSVVHLRIDRNSIFGGERDALPGQAEFSTKEVAIPLHEGLSDDDVAKVASAVKSGW